MIGSRSMIVVFGALYFLQTTVDAADGLATQPLQSLLKTWHKSPAQITTFFALLSVPWILKPLFGLCSDFVPWRGYRRKSYLLASSVVIALAFTSLYCFPPLREAHWVVLAALLASMIGVAFSSVVMDSLLVEQGQRSGVIARLQSVRWAATYTACVITGLAGGYLSAHQQYRLTFLVCGVGAAVAVALNIVGIQESVQAASSDSGLAKARQSMLAAFRSPLLRSVALYCLLLDFNPLSSAVVYLRMTKDLGISEQFYGLTRSIGAVASVLACLAYAPYARRLSLRQLVHLSIVLEIFGTLVYLGLDGIHSAWVISFVSSFAVMAATLIEVELTAEVCPLSAPGTTFAIVMATSNLGSSVATWLGGHLYEQGIFWWGHTVSFQIVTICGAACTAACWLVVPLLPASRSACPPDTAV